MTRRLASLREPNAIGSNSAALEDMNLLVVSEWWEGRGLSEVRAWRVRRAGRWITWAIHRLRDDRTVGTRAGLERQGRVRAVLELDGGEDQLGVADVLQVVQQELTR